MINFFENCMEMISLFKVSELTSHQRKRVSAKHE